MYLRKNGYSLESGLVIFDKASIMNFKTTLVLSSVQISSPKRFSPRHQALCMMTFSAVFKAVKSETSAKVQVKGNK